MAQQHQQIPEALTPFLRPVDELATLPGNPRVGDIDAVAASLEAFGQRYPIVVRDGTVIAGNHRLEAARRLGWTHIAVVDADDLTEEQARAFAVADNRTSDLADYDDALLASYLAGLDTELLASASYTADDLADILFASGAGQNDDPGAVNKADLHDLVDGWNTSGTRSFVLTFDLDTFRDLDERLAVLRSRFEVASNAEVFERLVRSA